jgi:hypothetical protein
MEPLRTTPLRRVRSERNDPNGPIGYSSGSKITANRFGSWPIWREVNGPPAPTVVLDRLADAELLGRGEGLAGHLAQSG